MPPALDGQTAVVTGGSSGIGRAISLAYAEEGANVVVADVREDPREEGSPTHEVIDAETDATGAYVDCDVTDPADLAAAADAAADLGGVDVWVNNAGIFRGEDFLEVAPEEYDRLMAVNVRGTFFGAQAAARRMVDGEGPSEDVAADGGEHSAAGDATTAPGDNGSIVNVSSVAGLRGSGGYATYCTSKGAVRLLTYALAAELGPRGVRVNAIHPGIIETAMTTDDVPIVGTEAGAGYLDSVPSRRWGQPGEIADAAVYLASDRASYVNGESLVVDGGMTSTN